MTNNKNYVFKSPMSKNYWKSAISETRNIRSIALVSILIAVRIAMSSFFIPAADGVRIYFSFIVVALIGFMFGPVMGTISGFIGDIIGFILFPSGAFFIGYTISAMLSGLIFGLLLYRTRITVVKLFIVKLITNLFVNAILGTTWRMIIVKDATYEYFISDFSIRIFKNSILLPFEVLILIIVFNTLIPILKSRNFLSEEIPSQITIF